MREDRNKLLTETTPRSSAGKVLRQYWVPVALTEELDNQRAVLPIKIMHEELVLFRDKNNNLGLLDRQCPHRGVDLSYGRLENNGLRCVFHGWCFDKNGQCLEQPGEPENSKLYQRIKTKSYPVMEINGVVFAYMGDRKETTPPQLDCFRAPDSHVFAFKGKWECNWLQALEVGIDPVHASFLHRFFTDEDPSDQYGKQFRDNTAGTDIPITKVLREFHRPDIHVDETNYGLRIKTFRNLNNGSTHARITNQIFPCAISIPMSNSMTITQWHVPVDDENCYWYAMFTSFDEPIDKEKMRAQRLADHSLPEYLPKNNKKNRYGFDRKEQETQTYTGMGMDINVHDQWACESMGTIQDRTNEHLATTDKAISAYRRMLLQSITKVEDGEQELIGIVSGDDAYTIRGPIALDAIGSSEDQDSIWLAGDQKRRNQSSWNANLYYKETEND